MKKQQRNATIWIGTPVDYFRPSYGSNYRCFVFCHPGFPGFIPKSYTAVPNKKDGGFFVMAGCVGVSIVKWHKRFN